MSKHVGIILGLVALVALTTAPIAAADTPPTLTIDPASQVGVTAAHLSGTVNPQGGPSTTYWRLEVAPADEPDAWSSAGGGEVSGADAEGTDPLPVSANATNLQPNREYLIRLLAENEQNPDTGEFANHVETEAPRPSFTTDPATTPILATGTITPAYTTAHLTATIDPQGGNLNPTSGPVPIVWYLQVKRPAEEGWTYAVEGQIEGPDAESSTPLARQGNATGLTPGATYEYRVFAYYLNYSATATSPEPNPTFETKAVPPPTLTIDPVTQVTDDTAHFQGTVDPEAPDPSDPAFEVTWHFECTPQCPGLPEPKTIPADSNPHPVEASATGLDPNTAYQVRLVAENKGGPAFKAESFTTSTAPPIVETLPPAVIDDDSAWIGAKVNPQNTPTAYVIELSADQDFPPVKTQEFSGSEGGEAASGNELVLVNHHAEGLEPATTYFYRVVAEGAGETTGETESFTTRAEPLPEQLGLPEGRVYEKVSPADKNGAGVWRGGKIGTGGARAQAAPSGDAVAYASVGNFAGDGSSLFSQYIGRRTAGGWATEGVTPPMEVRPGLNFTTVQWLSRDLSKALFSTPARLHGTEPAGQNLYFADLSAGTTEYIATSPYQASSTAPVFLAAVSENEHSFFLQIFGSDGNPREWRWSAIDGLEQVGDELPEGITTDRIGFRRFPEPFVSYPGDFPISSDGSHAFFTAFSLSINRGLYRRSFESDTPELISSSQRPADDPEEPAIAEFELASSDGTRAFFKSPAALTEGTVIDIGASLYLWDGTREDGEDLVEITSEDPRHRPDVLGTVGSSRDAKTVYFIARGVLAPGAVRGMPNLYLWHEDHPLRLIATLSPEDEDVHGDDLRTEFQTKSGRDPDGEPDGDARYRAARVSPDGRHLLFASIENLTAYDTNNTRQLYLFDRVTDEFSCISCSLALPRSSAGSWLMRTVAREDTENSSLPLPHNLAPDGSWVVFDSEDALVPADTDGLSDVYLWRDRELHLVSRGGNKSTDQLIDADSDATDIFFTTDDRLVGSDGDTVDDLYDARVGGQVEATESPACVGDECQGTPLPPPVFKTPASLQLNAPMRTRDGNVRCKRKKRRRSPARQCKRKSAKKTPAKSGQRKNREGATHAR